MDWRLQRIREEILRLGGQGLDWLTFATGVTELLRRVVPFDRSCWHTVDPGTILFTGSLNQGVGCSGSWLAHHEYVIEDVNKWSFLARSGRRAGATSLATHGDLSRSARHRSHESLGIEDELRASFVRTGTYWGAAGFLRDQGSLWFTEAEVHTVAGLSEAIAEGLRRAMLSRYVTAQVTQGVGPGVIVFDEDGHAESISPAAEHWVEQLLEEPPPVSPSESNVVQVVAARARAANGTRDPLELTARCRARTRSGSWVLLYGTRLSGGIEGKTAVIVQPAAFSEVVPLVALAYGLSERECQLAQLCIEGRSTKEMASALSVSPYTVQDHLKSIFNKTGARSRGELVGQVFLEHYVPRWEDAAGPEGWSAKDTVTVDLKSTVGVAGRGRERAEPV
ncbi:MAG TPA: helix-turn-helix transcriptional regulator [Actinomycetota bacterium]|nr:helix-turn-helix transcriptional regulator [Actinomycetota bacterium]